MIKIKLLRARFLGSKGFDSACLLPSAFLPHLLLLLTSQIHFSPVFLLVVYPPTLNDSFTNITLLHFFIPISSFPPFLEGSILYTCSFIIQILFSFLSLINHRNRSKCLIYWFAVLYRIKISLLTPQNSHEYIHNYNSLSHFHPTNYYLLLKFNLALLNSPRAGSILTISLPNLPLRYVNSSFTLATCCVDNLPVILLLRIDICRRQIPTFN